MKTIAYILTILFCLTTTTVLAQHKVLGADLSMLPVYEEQHVTYKDKNGNTIADVLKFFHEQGINTVRVRLFVNPTGETGVVQDLEFVKSFGKRIKDEGMSFMLDYHYSDTWADPAKQYIPREWGTDASEIENHIRNYTKETLQTLIDAGATPDYIQTGNEITFGMCSMKGTYDTNSKTWTKTSDLYPVYINREDNWNTFRRFLKAATEACREKCPQAKLILHTERASDWTTTKGIYDNLTTIDYDIIGLSYYPFWHGSLTTLKNTLDKLETTYGKEVMVVETAYYQEFYPTGEDIIDFKDTWAASPEGQDKFMDDLIDTLNNCSHVTGLFYWFPEENPKDNNVYEPWVNRGLFNNGYNDQTWNHWTKAHQALPALYTLKRFLQTPSAISYKTTEQKGDYTSAYYFPDGRRTGEQTLHPGIYIQQQGKTAKLFLANAR